MNHQQLITPFNSLNAIKDTKIKSFLKAMPSLYFSTKGVENIAKRFNVSIDHIQNLIDNLKGGSNEKS